MQFDPRLWSAHAAEPRPGFDPRPGLRLAVAAALGPRLHDFASAGRPDFDRVRRYVDRHRFGG
jgi:hypothetical protein